MKYPTLPFISLVLPLLVLLLQQGATLVGAECCDCPGELCPDGTGCDDFSCCAYGPCNIFCCACHNGCRTSSLNSDGVRRLGRYDSMEQDVLGAVTEAELAICKAQIVAADVNGDGNINFIEWAQSKESFGGVPWETLARRWSLYDWEGKGYLTLEQAMNRKF